MIQSHTLSMLQGIAEPTIRHLACRGGVKHISGLIYKEARGVLKIFSEKVHAFYLFLATPAYLLWFFRSSVIQSHTPSTLNERPSPPLMSSTPSSDRATLSMASVLRFSLGSISICYSVLGVYCTILIRISFVSYHVWRIECSLNLRSLSPLWNLVMTILQEGPKPPASIRNNRAD
jgi:hypothetical protein